MKKTPISKFVRVRPSPGGGRHSRKGYVSPKGSFMDRVLRKTAGRWQGGQMTEILTNEGMKLIPR